jgi:hypothetical protein
LGGIARVAVVAVEPLHSPAGHDECTREQQHRDWRQQNHTEC